MPGNMLDTWQEIAIPSKEGEKNARRVDGTNCWLSKSNDGSLGLIMVGVEPPNRKLDLENITFDFWDRLTLEYKGESLDLDNCLALDLNQGCDAGILVTVLDRMADYETSGKYRTDVIIKVLEEVIWLFKKERRPPTRDWGLGRAGHTGDGHPVESFSNRGAEEDNMLGVLLRADDYRLHVPAHRGRFGRGGQDIRLRKESSHPQHLAVNSS